MTDEFTATLRPHIRDGYRAARVGKPASANPWRPETVGGHAWALGWNIGSLPWWVRWMFARWTTAPCANCGEHGPTCHPKCPAPRKEGGG